MIGKKVYVPRSRSFRRGVTKRSGGDGHAIESDLGRGAFFTAPRTIKESHTPPVADHRKLIRSDVARRERVKTDREKKRERARGAPGVRVHAYAGIMYLFYSPFRMGTLFISRPVSSRAGTKRAGANVIKLVSLRNGSSIVAVRSMGALDRFSFSVSRNRACFLPRSWHIFHSRLAEAFLFNSTYTSTCPHGERKIAFAVELQLYAVCVSYRQHIARQILAFPFSLTYQFQGAESCY